MSKTFYDVYIGEHNRTYLVAPLGYGVELTKSALKRFKKSRDQISVRVAWVVGDELYLEYPKIAGAEKIFTAFIKSNIRRTTYGD